MLPRLDLVADGALLDFAGVVACGGGVEPADSSRGTKDLALALRACCCALPGLVSGAAPSGCGVEPALPFWSGDAGALIVSFVVFGSVGSCGISSDGCFLSALRFTD